MVIIVMGVSGSGKTTIGELLAETLHWSFADADDFHSPANVAKMKSGQPLNDADRQPWLAALRAHIAGCLERNENAIVACSALKESYRTVLVPDWRRVRLVHLHGSPELIKARLAHRRGHFMRPELADSQFAALELPANALTLDVSRAPSELVAEIRRAFGI